MKISFERNDSFDVLISKLSSFFENIQSVFSSFAGKFFSQKELEDEIVRFLSDGVKAEKISKFILSSYSGRLTSPGVIEPNAFLQQRREVDGYKYRIFNNQYLASFSALLVRANKLFGYTDDHIVGKYVTNKETNSINYVRLGYFIEMLELGTFEIKGGENPMVFVRINDPLRVERDSNNNKYKNVLLAKTLERHSLSNQIFDHFFLRSFSNEERWGFIEDFFLGMDVDILMEKYKGDKANQVNIIDFLSDISKPLNAIPDDIEVSNNVHVFHPKGETFYDINHLITIESEGIVKTLKVSEWLAHDPVAFHKVYAKYKLRVSSEIFDILISKLRSDCFDYFRDSLGLNMRIEFKGFDTPVKAIVPYNDNPVEFYKWWCDNLDKVTLTFREKLTLFDKVQSIKPSSLKAEHKKVLKK